MRSSLRRKETLMGKYKEEHPRLSIEECVTRRLYKIKSRNLTYGVYNGNEGFLGIRFKMGGQFLFTEFHWDQGPPYGTVYGVEDTGIDLPEDIELKETVSLPDNRFSSYAPLYEWLKEQGGEPTDVGPNRFRDALKKKDDDASL